MDSMTLRNVALKGVAFVIVAATLVIFTPLVLLSKLAEWAFDTLDA